MAAHTSTVQPPGIFMANDQPLYVLVEPHSVPLRVNVITALRTGGARIVSRLEDAQIIIVDPSSEQGQVVVRDWHDAKVCLSYKWVQTCVSAGRALLEQDDWGSHLAHVTRRDGTLPTPRSSPATQLPPIPTDPEFLDVSFDRPGPSAHTLPYPGVPTQPFNLNFMPNVGQCDPAQAQAQAQAAMQTLMSNPYVMQAFMAQMATAGFPLPPVPPAPPAPGPGPFASGWPMPLLPFGSIQATPPPAFTRAEQSPLTLVPERKATRTSLPPPPVQEEPAPPSTEGSHAPQETSSSTLGSAQQTMEMEFEHFLAQQESDEPSANVTEDLPPLSSRGPPKRRGDKPSPSPGIKSSVSRKQHHSVSPLEIHSSSSIEEIYPDSQEEDESAVPAHPVFQLPDGKPLKIYLQHDDLFRTRKQVLQLIRANGGSLAYTIEDADYVVLFPSRALPGIHERTIKAGKLPLGVPFIEDSVASGILQNPKDYKIKPAGSTSYEEENDVEPSQVKPRKRAREGRVKEEPRSESPALLQLQPRSCLSTGTPSLPPRARKVQRRVSFMELDYDEDELRSPSPPYGPPTKAGRGGGYKYTEEEHAFFEAYTRVLLKRQDMSKPDVGAKIAEKIPHHSKGSWGEYVRHHPEVYEEAREAGIDWRMKSAVKRRRLSG